MNRRTFIAAAPLAAAGLAFAGEGSAQTVAPPLNPSLPGTQFYPGVQPGDRPVGASFATRSEVFGRNGAAASSHPLGTLAGIEILKKGGSAVDAAIAINAAHGFLEPTANGIGGDLYAMLWDPAASRVVGIAGSGRSPRGLSLETVRSRARNGVLPAYGAVTVTVPGTVDAWWRLHQRYGKAALGRTVRAGDRLCRRRRAALAGRRPLHEPRRWRTSPGPGSASRRSPTPRRPLPPGDRARAGEIFRNPDLARTYRMIAAGRPRRLLRRRRSRARSRPISSASAAG